MMKPRGLRSNTPSVHIDKDRGNEAIVLQRRTALRADAIECSALIERINSSCGVLDASVPARMQVSRDFCGANRGIGASGDTTQGDRPARSSMQPQETYTFPGEKIAGYIGFAALVAMTIVIVAYAPKARAQTPTIKEIVSPPEVFCPGAQKRIAKTLAQKGMFKDAFALSGEGARQVSQNVFDFSPPADHVIIIRELSRKSIMVPCVWGKNGPYWAGDKARRVAVDFVFTNELDNPKTELPENSKAKK